MRGNNSDGSAGDANYAVIGQSYSQFRQPEPAIAMAIAAALGNATTVINVGAGAGSYEPTTVQVTAVEPSASMRAQRPPHLTQAVDATAESLPFANKQFDAAMATFTVHQWADLSAGLSELRRVTTGPIAILTCDPLLVCDFWLFEYAPEVLRAEARRYPTMAAIAAALQSECEVVPVMIPLHCKDGFNEAYYGRPERLLNPGARLACSAWSFVDQALEERYVRRLASDLADGTWDHRWGHLRAQSEYQGSLRLIVSNP